MVASGAIAHLSGVVWEIYYQSNVEDWVPLIRVWRGWYTSSRLCVVHMDEKASRTRLVDELWILLAQSDLR